MAHACAPEPLLRGIELDDPMRESELEPGQQFNRQMTSTTTAEHDDGVSVDNGSTLTKAELADLLFERVGLNKREAKDMVETFFEEIRFALQRGDSVKLSGFGNFQLRDKPQRPGRNPKTGEAIPITARRVVTFHASQKLKAMVDGVTPSAAAS